MITLAVDCMGGDHGPRVTLAACRTFLEQHPEARLLLVGLPQALEGFVHERATLVPASEVVTMDDAVEVALRRKKDSSMRVAIQQVKDGTAQAAVSAGNTGALMAIARYVLKTLDGIDRPAIAGQMPNVRGGSTTMLDLGANVDCTAQHLLQFAIMGSALDTVLKGNEQPSVGLLNIGEEAIKGQRRSGYHGGCFPAAGILPQCVDQNGRRRRISRAVGLQEARGPPPLQRCCAAGTARTGVQKPRLGRRGGIRPGTEPRL